MQAIEKAITLKNKLWYESFTITNNVKDVDISKAKKILGYHPK
jgi:hypothetical protein